MILTDNGFTSAASSRTMESLFCRAGEQRDIGFSTEGFNG